MMRLAVFLVLITSAAPIIFADERLPEKIEFNRDVRPILSENCFFCHGPDKNKRQADLRLDTSESLIGTSDRPGVVKPHHPESSDFYAKITSADPEVRMPPVDSGKSLSPRDIALLKKWIEQGAPYEGHWSFQPIKKPTPPDVAGANFIRNPIDHFILAELQQHGLEPSAEADKITLIRRLYFDLTGLPPTPQEVDQFVSDQRPEAYESLVNRLLESPHFGERMAVWWLDLVRYADTVGYHGDQNMSVFPYREYVIRSFNENKQFDVFTREQLAGDLLPNATAEHKIASGYNRLGMMSAEGGVQDKEYLAKYIAERVRNVSGTWLGSTMGCAECHDHKYDPFTMRDFYSMEAFFADIEERGLYSGAHATGEWGPTIKVPKPEQIQQLAKLDADIASVKQTLNTPTDELAKSQASWEQSIPRWTVLSPMKMESTGKATLKSLEDGSILVSGENPTQDTYTLTIANLPEKITAFRLEALPDDSLPAKGPGRFTNGNFVLTEFAVRHQPAGEIEPQLVTLQNATADFEQAAGAETSPWKKFAAAALVDRDEKGAEWGWAILNEAGKPHVAMMESEKPLAGGNGAELTIQLIHRSIYANHALGRFRVSVTSQPLPIRADQQPPTTIAVILSVPAAERNDSQKNELAGYYRSISPLLEPLRAQLKSLEQAKAELDKAIPTTLVTRSTMPRMVRLLMRGNWMDESGEEMRPAFPAFLPQPSKAVDQRLTRRDLADWIMSPENPLTARAYANRQWKLFFGAGLSRKLEDLGGQGEAPTHPLLLDWLATQFRESNWNIKEFAKLLVMSGTYRQTSIDNAKLREADPYNRLLARQGRFRLDAEFVRDNALAVSGLLVTKFGGPSVHPYQPPGYWAYLNFPMREWQNGTGEELYRRGLYTHWQRQYLHPSLLAFDAPSREECTADRARSNTPLQSLALLNDPTYVEAARSLAERTLEVGGETTDGRILWLFRRVLSRAPKRAESQVVAALLEKHRAEYHADPAAATAVLAIGAKPTPTDLPAIELAAWTSVTRTVLNLHETMTRN